MKKILVFSSFFVCLLTCYQVPLSAQNDLQHNTSAWAGLEHALQPGVKAINLMGKPILIEQDLMSDRYFQQALAAFDKKDDLSAARSIREGAQALLKEAPVDVHNPQRKLVEQRVGELFGLSLKVENGMTRDRETLQDYFADATESVAHRYYEGTHTLLGADPATFSDWLLGLSVHLRNSQAYHKPFEKAAVGKAADDAAQLAAEIKNMKPGERELTPPLNAKLKAVQKEVEALKLDQ